MTSPVMDTFHFDQFPETCFDTYADPSLFFDFDACAEGLVPGAVSPAAPSGADANAGPDIESLFGDGEMLTVQVTPTADDIALPSSREPMPGATEQQQQSPPVLADDFSLWLPLDPATIQPAQLGGDYPLPDDDFDVLFGDVSSTIADTLHLPTPPAEALDPLTLPATSWPAGDAAAAFDWNSVIGSTGLDYLEPQPCSDLFPLDGAYDAFGAFGAFDDSSAEISEGLRDPTSLTPFFYPSPSTATEVFAAPAAQPRPEEPLDSWFPDLASISADQIPFTFDDGSADDVLCSLPPVVSLNAPQPVNTIPRSVPTVAASNTAAQLVHPKPISPKPASFIHQRDEDVDPAPRSILDGQGLLDVAPATSFYLTPAPTPARDLTTPVVDGKVIKRIPRPAKAKDVNASDWYDALPRAPTPWGGSDPKNPLFQYNREGELLPNLRFSRGQILYYMKQRKDRGLPLTLWIQNVPHGCKERVGDSRLRACRWSGCPAVKGTILKGFWRVCFDERPATSGKQHDPYHNAGYMHLWCLDRCFDLVEIAQAFDLKPDTRYFEKEERNAMAMTRDHDELVLEFENWRTSQQKAYDEWQASSKVNKMLGLPGENRWVDKEAKLWYVLTTRHLVLETPVRSNMRKKRNGISIDKHIGDLEWYVKRVNEKKAAKKSTHGHAKASAAGCCEEQLDSDDDEDALEAQAGKTRQRRMKRKLDALEHDDDDDDQDFRPQTAGSNKRRRCSRRSM
ncbi:hypothetical protein EsH8_IV_001127 [Colletotrichum jinshuiense]